MKLKARDWVLIAVALGFTLLCVRLGLWQLDRLGQRKERNAVIAAGRAQPAFALTGMVTAEQADALVDRPIRTQGVYDYAHERIWPARGFDGVPGVAILTPLRLPDGAFVFVDRGWVGAPDGRSVDLRRLREGDAVAVLGVAQRAPRGRGDVDPARLRDSLPGPVLPIVVRQLADGGLTLVRRWPEAKLTNGPHLGYAIQWFSFATITVVGTVILLKGGRARAGTGGHGR